jgi:hypothetical protein
MSRLTTSRLVASRLTGRMVGEPSTTWTPAVLFADGQDGMWFEYTTAYSDTAGTTPAAVDDLVERLNDLSGNGRHAARDPVYPDPEWFLTLKEGYIEVTQGWLVTPSPDTTQTGTMIWATVDGVAAFAATIASYDDTFEGFYNVVSKFGVPSMGGKFVGMLFREGAMTENEIESAIGYFQSIGAGDFSGATDATNYFNLFLEVTEILGGYVPFATESYQKAFRNMSITSAPSADFSITTDCSYMFEKTPISDVPAGYFDGTPCTNFDFAFTSTNLTQSSIDNVLVSINSNGTSGGTFNQTGGSAPSSTGQAAITAMRGRGWTVTVTGGF